MHKVPVNLLVKRFPLGVVSVAFRIITVQKPVEYCGGYVMDIPWIFCVENLSITPSSDKGQNVYLLVAAGNPACPRPGIVFSCRLTVAYDLKREFPVDHLEPGWMFPGQRYSLNGSFRQNETVSILV